MPWLQCHEERTCGRLAFIPYLRGKAGLNLQTLTQADLDAVLSNYHDSSRTAVKYATLIGLDGRPLDYQHPDDDVAEIFRLGHLLTFAALAKRRFFSEFNYCNTSAYYLVGQQVRIDNPDALSFGARRRDGSARRYCDSQDFAFRRPEHVPSHLKLDPEWPLLDALWQIEDERLAKRLDEAIAAFNAANTDALEVTERSEIVLTKAAFEYLFGIRHERVELEKALAPVVRSRLEGEEWPYGSLDGEIWRKRWQKADRVFDAWIADFSTLRGKSAHGVSTDAKATFWSTDNHLLFSAFLFPLVVKVILAEANLYALTDYDQIAVARCEQFLVHDHFAPRSANEDPPWRMIDDDLSERALAMAIEATMLDSLDALVSP